MLKKSSIFIVLAALSFARGEAASPAATNPPAAPANPLRLILPKAVYAVPGQEMNIYFDNIVLTPNLRNYVINVADTRGRQDQDRWRYTATTNDVGSFPWRVKVMRGDKTLVAEGETVVHVVPRSAGKGRRLTVLVVGDSLTNASRYPRELFRLLKTEGNTNTVFIGRHSGGGRPPADGFAHEGYGGWTWRAFCTRWGEPKNEKDYQCKSSFLRLVDGKPTLDFQNYCNTYNEGKPPDFITVFLGCNDTFSSTEETIEKTIDSMFRYADMLLAEFRRVGPDTQIGLLLLVPPAASQDAFGSNYKCGQTRWQYRRNQHRVVERTMEAYGDREGDNIFLVPTYVNIDCVDGYPQREEPINARNPAKISRHSNGVHPATPGYDQIADSIYAWMRYRLGQK